jgi:hypothetical protein
MKLSQAFPRHNGMARWYVAERRAADRNVAAILAEADLGALGYPVRDGVTLRADIVCQPLGAPLSSADFYDFSFAAAAVGSSKSPDPMPPPAGTAAEEAARAKLLKYTNGMVGSDVKRAIPLTGEHTGRIHPVFLDECRAVARALTQNGEDPENVPISGDPLRDGVRSGAPAYSQRLRWLLVRFSVEMAK